MRNELTEGRKLDYVITSVGEDGQAGFAACDIGSVPPSCQMYQCKEIVVTMESGPMAAIPWAKCTEPNGAEHMINLSLVPGLGLKGGDS